MATVIILDDEEKIRELMSISIRAEGYDVFTAATAEEVYAFLEKATAEREYSPREMLIITDIRMPGIQGLEVIETLHEKYPGLPFIICSTMTSTPVVEDSYEVWKARHQIVGQFDKPMNMPRLLSTINATLDK
jgi:DNA-binding NtrC family response regulator